MMSIARYRRRALGAALLTATTPPLSVASPAHDIDRACHLTERDRAEVTRRLPPPKETFHRLAGDIGWYRKNGCVVVLNRDPDPDPGGGASRSPGIGRSGNKSDGSEYLGQPANRVMPTEYDYFQKVVDHLQDKIGATYRVLVPGSNEPVSVVISYFEREYSSLGKISDIRIRGKIEGGEFSGRVALLTYNPENESFGFSYFLDSP